MEDRTRSLSSKYFLPTIVMSILLAMLCTTPTLAQPPGDGSDVELTESDIIIFCEGHKGGVIKAARDHGKKRFGSLENFYNNYHRIQCPPHFPSPLYMSISLHAESPEVDKEIEYISRLSPERRHLILNRPSKGFFKQTVLGVVVRKLKINKDAGNDAVVARYKNLKKMLRNAGAKRVEELTEEEKGAFN
jgi:hypothetical protein